MSEYLPLMGKSILVPRGKTEAKSFSTLVEKYGGVPMEIPLIAFQSITPSTVLREKLDALHTYDWIIFTSNVTVETFLCFYQNQIPTMPKIAVIGVRTAAVLEKKGYHVHFVPDEYVAEGFVREFLPHVTKGMKILIPKGNLARDYIAESLINAGALVDEIIVYQTYLPEDSKQLLKTSLVEKKLDVLTFTSPSTVDHFMEVVNENQLHKNIEDCLIACIGPVTKDRIEFVGLKVDVSPDKYTVEDMLKGIVVHIQNNH
jgi:uroporphyrinogen-III synthase